MVNASKKGAKKWGVCQTVHGTRRSGPEVREGPRAGEAASVKSGEFKMRGRDNEGGRTPRTRTAAQSSAAAAALDGAWSKAAKFVIKKVQGRPADATLNAEEENERKEGKALREMRIEKATKSQTAFRSSHTTFHTPCSVRKCREGGRNGERRME